MNGIVLNDEQREFLRAGHTLVLMGHPRYPIVVMWRSDRDV